ncbi:MAG: hypothetical protein M1816_005258 [Peltula sp. TS41687]|nr:MAG: hypothetical protein M1816_005258 [Peltula sp. TS41687]
MRHPPLPVSRKADALDALRTEPELVNIDRQSPSEDGSEGVFMLYRLVQLNINELSTSMHPNELVSYLREDRNCLLAEDQILYEPGREGKSLAKGYERLDGSYNSQRHTS